MRVPLNLTTLLKDPQQREVRSFFYSQYFTDGLRMTLGILMPSLVMLYGFGELETGFTLSLGALTISGIDSPGPVAHKRNAMALGNVLNFLVAIITGFARLNIVTMGIEVTLLSFIFSLLIVYGNRAASVGLSGLLTMVFMMGKQDPEDGILPLALTLLAGGVWYMIFSLIFFGIRPYRAAQQTLGENIAELAKFLRIKAAFYDPDIDIDDNYHKLVARQVQVSQHQDAVREILFKSRITVKESTRASRMLVLTFVDLVDMFEQIMATHYDYEHIRRSFAGTGALKAINKTLNRMADELDNVGFMVLANIRHKRLISLHTDLEELKQLIDQTSSNMPGESSLVLKKILVNLRDLVRTIDNIYSYYDIANSKGLAAKKSNIEYDKFVTHQDYAPHIFFDNLSLESSAFKHALRVGLVCFAGFVIAKFIAPSHHSYWILLTIIVILKPGFSLSKERNYQRLIGTIGGGIVGVLILAFIKNANVQFALMLLFMVGTYSFIRLNYIVCVIFMTPFVLIMLKFLGIGGYDVVKERILDTIIGSSIAFIASYFVFPSWEFEQIRENMRSVVFANTTYLIKIGDTLAGKPLDVTEYKLARKEVYVQSANLSAAFQRMTSEPKNKQIHIKDVHKFVVLNHILSSYVATIASGLANRTNEKSKPELLRSIKKSVSLLNEASTKLHGPLAEFKVEKQLTEGDTIEAKPATEEGLLQQQLSFINKISADILKVTGDVLQ